jgi:hypothetical protein
MGFDINGANFGALQGDSTVTLNGRPLAVISWGDQTITVEIPFGSTTGEVVVTKGVPSVNNPTFVVVPAFTCP